MIGLSPKTILTLSAVAGAASAAFTLPKGHPNGVYNIGVDANGKQTIEKVGDVTAPPTDQDWTAVSAAIADVAATKASAKFKRDAPQDHVTITCSTGTSLTETDIGAAAYSLAKVCQSIGSTGTQAAVSGDAVFYHCDSRTVFQKIFYKATPCSYDRAVSSMQGIEKGCSDVIGTLLSPIWPSRNNCC